MSTSTGIGRRRFFIVIISCLLLFVAFTVFRNFKQMSRFYLSESSAGDSIRQKNWNASSSIASSMSDWLSQQNSDENRSTFSYNQTSAAFSASLGSAVKQNSTNTMSSKIRTFAPSVDSPLKADLVVYLSGEFGNHLAKMATGYAVKAFAMDPRNNLEIPIDFRIHWRGQGLRKSESAARDCHNCLVHMKNENFTECNNEAFDQLTREQSELFGKDIIRNFNTEGIEGDVMETLKKRLDLFAKTLLQNKGQQGLLNSTEKGNSSTTENVTSLTTPFFVANTFCPEKLLGHYKEEITKALQFNTEKCCKKIPEPDESVVHIRGFTTEMSRRGVSLGFEELDANRTAQDLLAHLKPGDKVVFLSRFNNILQPYVEAVERRGLVARKMTGQSGTEDFCFLMMATKEILGPKISTYVRWASFLSTTVKKVKLYCIDSEAVRRSKKKCGNFSWTDLMLEEKFEVRTFKVS